MKKQNLSLAYSTCPNDTFIFYALAHNLINTGDLSFSITLDDVESLNQKAENGFYDITKLSFAAIGNLQREYRLLRAGAALGRGCGPLLVAKPGYNLNRLGSCQVAVPGLNTTANLLLELWSENKNNPAPMTFDRIMPALNKGEYEFGLIIHEGRFTYRDYGLECVIDLGKWWEELTSLPIPLGGIAVKKSLPLYMARQIEKSIGDSVAYALQNKNAADPYIKKHAQELDDTVIAQHIELYVNSFSQSLGNEGEKAIEFLFELAREKGLMEKSKDSIFAT